MHGAELRIPEAEAGGIYPYASLSLYPPRHRSQRQLSLVDLYYFEIEL
jgi:hypothetical protein